jgi:hypothetical protein
VIEFSVQEADTTFTLWLHSTGLIFKWFTSQYCQCVKLRNKERCGNGKAETGRDKKGDRQGLINASTREPGV